ncbi:MAG: hypothetical protein HYV00_08015 [Deltaproteobacteria bacterium]|nr:hypothetical protein [Deltaproteobacteria bacterium]
MRKQTQKSESFIPPQGKKEYSWVQLVRRARQRWVRETKNQRTASALEEDLKRWIMRVESLPTWPGILGEEVRGEASLLNREERTSWIKGIIENRDTLESLHYRHALSPSKVLDYLWHLKEEDLLFGEADDHLTQEMRSLRARTRDADALEKAAEILEKWHALAAGLPLPSEKILRYPSGYQLRKVAQALRDLGAAQAHRPSNERLNFLVVSLVKQFMIWTGLPLYEHAGRLIRAAFPSLWNPAGDIREAAKKIFKEAESRSSSKDEAAPSRMGSFAISDRSTGVLVCDPLAGSIMGDQYYLILRTEDGYVIGECRCISRGKTTEDVIGEIRGTMGSLLDMTVRHIEAVRPLRHRVARQRWKLGPKVKLERRPRKARGV